MKQNFEGRNPFLIRSNYKTKFEGWEGIEVYESQSLLNQV